MDDGTSLTPREQIRHEQDRWNAVVHHVLPEGAELVSVSCFVTDSRVYRGNNKAAKIRRLEGSHPDTELRREVASLQALSRNASYATWGEWEYSVQDEMPGTRFSNYLFDQQDTAFGVRARLRVLRNLLPELKELHRHGVSHGDLNPENLLIERDKVTLIDFDRATRGSRLHVVLRDWIGVGKGLQRRTPVWKLALFVLVPKSKSLARRVRWRLVKARTAGRPVSGATDVGALRNAWDLAESSSANSRGQGVAYYAWSYRAQHYSGERAWQLRWEPISKTVDFAGKSVLELGCNMGLLSTFATVAGARDALGVDHDSTIIDSARKVAAALDVPARFEQVDLTDESDWESRLGGHDIVTALSVVHWLPNRDRVLKFLSQHQELIYEGHDRLDVEIDRLNALGFDLVDVVMTTERDRQLLHARQSSAPRN